MLFLDFGFVLFWFVVCLGVIFWLAGVAVSMVILLFLCCLLCFRGILYFVH